MIPTESEIAVEPHIRAYHTAVEVSVVFGEVEVDSAFFGCVVLGEVAVIYVFRVSRPTAVGDVIADKVFAVVSERVEFRLDRGFAREIVDCGRIAFALIESESEKSGNGFDVRIVFENRRIDVLIVPERIVRIAETKNRNFVRSVRACVEIAEFGKTVLIENR